MLFFKYKTNKAIIIIIIIATKMLPETAPIITTKNYHLE